MQSLKVFVFHAEMLDVVIVSIPDAEAGEIPIAYDVGLPYTQ